MYDERLTAPRSWWLLPVALGLTLALILLRVGGVAALIGLVIGIAAGAAAVNSYGSARIRVVQGSLVAGQARIPVEALGEAHPLTPVEAVAWRGVKADPRAFMLLRSYVPTALRVEVTDPADPTPYLYLSTRSPERLAAALAEARRRTA
ncbi:MULTISPECIES: DUF3093 domain-containing protein [Streptomycetaceae]|uniref:DUF3093 domain-containing protein n=1 Tax=Kitasatospora herbaricolor TaxID=68217 RepID=A0ABZ1W6X7_9ACTN|nr:MULTISPECIES: DUF3093 domain-containing protein [Streptomycetaceae]MCX5210465.1 DUF3093 domain-containing protein [Kitasatospora sp. NBC_00240]MDQ0310944.1 hypothetical protein [Kitasatospora herbaricolor]OKI23119.1 hypothetical protein A6A07_33030 [Streptomyces sp. CB03911]GGV27790.1 membrane protein [Kitasatospora herbaricolor]